MSDQPPPVVARDIDRPLDHESATDQRPTDLPAFSIEEAAAQLGITVNAVRQRLKRATLHGEKTPAGWVVFLSTDHATSTDRGRHATDQPATRSRPAAGQPPDQSTIAPLAELIATLSRENQELAAAAALWQERARFLGEQLRAIEPGPIAQDAGDHAAQDAIPGPVRDDVATKASESLAGRLRRLLGR